APAEADVPVQGAGLVLGHDDDPAELAVDAVGQGEVDDPVQAAERDGRLGPVPGERVESGPAAPGENDGQDVAHGQSSARILVGPIVPVRRPRRKLNYSP